MRSEDRWAGGGLLLLAGVAAWQALGLRIGVPSRPGPGFFPLVLAVLLLPVAAGFLWCSRRSSRGPSPEPVRITATTQVASFKGRWTFLALAAYILALEPVGFLAATFLFLVVLYRVVEPRRWSVALGGSALMTALCYGMFALLRVPLPAGLWLR